MLNHEVKNAAPAMFYAGHMETMGDRIRQLRVARDMTQPDLAEKCGVTKSAVSQWESGAVANIKLRTFLALLEALGTDAAYLIWGPSREPLKPSPERRKAS